ncbi:MAG: hypothetical protein KDD99_27460 [Bacteroidetes bacterium]|nr:hypothetical protein [Bacteroidota bacterium]
MIPVIMGVLIALYIDNWKTERDNKRFLDGVLGSIEVELKDTQEGLEKVLPKQYTLIDTLDYYMEDPKISIVDCFVKCNGLQVIPVKNNSWWSFLNTKIEIVGYETISQLGGIEASMQFMSMKVNKMMDFIYENSESTDIKHKKMLKIQILNLIDSEEGLIEEHKGYLEP